MKKLILTYYNKWYLPVFISCILGIIGIYIITFPYEITFYIAVALPCISLFISGILGIIKLFKKQYLFGALQLISTVVVAIAGLCFLVFYLVFYPYDFYANDLEIPKNIEINIPKDSSSNVFEKPIDFKLYNSFQPGIYTYDISIDKTEKGTIFLKAFEVTQNDELSFSSLKSASALAVKASDTIIHYRLKEDFTIYEGDWDHPYAARFEMWFKNDSTGKETKLAQKTYKIEGWMR